MAWRALPRSSVCCCKSWLVVIVARLIFAWWQRHNMPAPAYAAAHPATGHSFGGLSGMLGGTNATPAGEPLTVAKSDYDAFERLLGDIQAAFSAEDLSAMRAKVTPKMLPYLSEQLAGNASRGSDQSRHRCEAAKGRSSRSLARRPIPIMRPWR